MVSIKSPHEYIFIPLDTPDLDRALAITSRLKGLIGGVKIGKEFFTALGPAGVQKIKALGTQIFVDLKFHDIPNTVAKAIKAAAELGAWMANVHASGGRRMMTAAKEALDEQGGAMQLIAVTVLTSMDEADLLEVGVPRSPGEQVMHLAQLSQKCGLDGVVCSAQEAEVLKASLGADFKLVTPGIRLAASVADDQRRIVSPADAVALGSDYLVIGRPITQSENPLETLRQINESIDHKV